MAWILCRVWTVRSVWMMWRQWRQWRLCSGWSHGDVASCVECGDSGGVEHGVDTVQGVDSEECVDDVETVETVEIV